jgi:hypothetical protein
LVAYQTHCPSLQKKKKKSLGKEGMNFRHSRATYNFYFIFSFGAIWLKATQGQDRVAHSLSHHNKMTIINLGQNKEDQRQHASRQENILVPDPWPNQKNYVQGSHDMEASIVSDPRFYFLITPPNGCCRTP